MVSRRFTLIAAVLALVGGAALLAPGGAEAHERRAVAGKYTFVVGFQEEPALLEQPNGVSLTVADSQTNQPVAGVEKTLKVEVFAGDQSKTMDLTARFGQTGAYTATFIPTRAGQYVFRFFGTIDGTQINERFESGPGRFNDVESTAALQFPVQVPSNGELAAQRGTPAEAGAASGAVTPEVQRALDRADSARRTAIGFGVAGVAAGLLGLGLAAYALTARRAPTRDVPCQGEPV